MAEPDDGVLMFVPLMTLNRELFTAGNYNAAYHLLAGALYVAGDDVQYLALVEQVAREQVRFRQLVSETLEDIRDLPGEPRQGG